MASVRPKTRLSGNQPKIFIGGALNDGGGYAIMIDRFGKVHIKPVPPWQPDLERLAVAMNLQTQADRAKSRDVRKQLRALAEQMVSEAAPALDALFAGMART